MSPLVAACLVVGFAIFVWWLWREDSLFWSTSEAGDGMPSLVQPRTERILFVCTHNAARSQMAEAWLRHIGGTRFQVHSAGMAPTHVHPLVVQVMAEVGIILRSPRAKGFAEVGTAGWDQVITLCDTAFERCPEFPAKTARLHWSLEDPSRAAPERQLEAFRWVRDDLAQRLRQWVGDHTERP